MSEPLEYTYEDKSEHLSEREALEQYAQAKRDHPDAIVVLRDFDCGHWRIKIYDSADEKNVVLSKRLDSLLQTFWSALRLKPKTP